MEVRDLRASESDIINDIRQDVEDRIYALGPDFREIFPFYKKINDTIKAVQKARERNAGVKTVSLAEQVWNCGEKAVKDGLQFVSKEAQKAKDFAVKSGKQVVGDTVGLAQDGLQAVGLHAAAKSAGEIKDFVTKPGLKNRLAQSGKQVIDDVVDGVGRADQDILQANVKAGKQVFGTVSDLAQKATDGTKKVINGAGDFGQDILQAHAKAGKQVFGAAAGIAQAAADGTKKIINGVGDLGQDILQANAKAGKQVFGAAAGIAQDGLQAVGLHAAAKSAGEVKDFVTKPGLKNRLAQSGKQVIDDVVDGGKKLVTGIIKTSKDFMQSGVKLMDETWNCGAKYKQKVDRVVDRAIINVTEAARRKFMGR